MHDVKKEKRWVFGRLFAGDVAAKGLCLDPVHEDEDTVASCFHISLARLFLLLFSFLLPSTPC